LEQPEDSVQGMVELRRDLTRLKLNSVKSKTVLSVVVEQSEWLTLFGNVKNVKRDLQEVHIT